MIVEELFGSSKAQTCMMLPFIIAALITLSCVFLCGATDNIVKDVALEITDHDGISRLDLNDFQIKDMKEKLSAVFSSAENGVSATTTTQGFLLQRRDKNGHSTKTSRLLKRDEDRSLATPERVLAQRSSASNLCLEPPDPHRTCFRRSIDPDNHYDYDFIDRKKYNLEGKRGTLPYLALDEQVFYGTMIISMLDNEQDVDTCDSRLSMEELLLTFLADNIGGLDTYTPICAFMNKYAFEYQEVPETDEDISGTAFHFQLTFAQSSRVPNWRRVLKEDEEQSVFLQNDLVERDLRKDKQKKNQKENKNDGGKKQKQKQTNTSSTQRNNGGKKNRKNNGSKEKNSGHKNRPNNGPNSGRNTGNKTKDKTKKKENIKDNEKAKKYVKPTMKPTLLNCRASDQAMCCSQVAINGSPGAYCVELGCDLSLCGSGRKQEVDNSWKGGWGGASGWSGRQRQLKESRKLTMKNANFNDLIPDYTPYNPTQTYAQLDIDFEFANSCSINRFSLGQYGTPSLFCSVFREQGCEQNNDLLPSVEEEFSIFCIDDSEYSHMIVY